MNAQRLTRLAELHAATLPGQRRTAEEIAAYVQCPTTSIQRIEWRALAKLARALSCTPLGKELHAALFTR